MTDVTVVCGIGDRAGEDIQEGLLASDQAAIARGQSELNALHPSSSISLVCRYRSDIRIGDMVEVRNVAQGVTYRAQVLGIALQASNPVDAAMQLTLWRPE